jgi:hypothetical protein
MKKLHTVILKHGVVSHRFHNIKSLNKQTLRSNSFCVSLKKNSYVQDKSTLEECSGNLQELNAVSTQ